MVIAQITTDTINYVVADYIRTTRSNLDVKRSPYTRSKLHKDNIKHPNNTLNSRKRKISGLKTIIIT
jgi:hypothetical protein